MWCICRTRKIGFQQVHLLQLKLFSFPHCNQTNTISSNLLPLLLKRSSALIQQIISLSLFFCRFPPGPPLPCEQRLKHKWSNTKRQTHTTLAPAMSQLLMLYALFKADYAAQSGIVWSRTHSPRAVGIPGPCMSRVPILLFHELKKHSAGF